MFRHRLHPLGMLLLCTALLVTWAGCGGDTPEPNGNDNTNSNGNTNGNSNANGNDNEPGPGDSDTRVLGKVLSAVSDEPLAGVRIAIADVDGVVHTDAAGTFEFAVPTGGTYALTATLAGYTYAQRWAEVNTGQLAAVREMYLTPIDPAAISVGPGGGSGANSDGSIEVDVPAGALDSTAELHATWYDRGKHLPNTLPTESHFTYACELTPNGQTFDEPITVRMRNERGFAPGTPIPVGVYNDETLAWEPESMGVVSDDGEWVVFTVEHFSPRDCNLGRRAPGGSGDPGDAEDVTISDLMDIRTCGSVPSGSRVGVADGRLLIDHVLPAYRRLDEWSALALQYDSQRVASLPALELSYDISQTSVLLPERMRYTIEIAGRRIERYFQPVEGSMLFTYRWDGRDGLDRDLPDGTYDYRLTLTNEYPAEFATASVFAGPAELGTGVMADELVELSTSFTGTITLAREAAEEAPLGRGWDFVDVFRLLDEGDRVRIVHGGNETYAFTREADDSLTPTAGEFTTLAEVDAGFVWFRLDRSEITFDSAGRQVSLADRNGNTTTYAYNADGMLTSITDPVGLVTTFAWSATNPPRLTTVTDPAGRATSFEVNDAGELVQITNPDGSTRQFAYDADHRLTSQTDAGGHTTSYTYDAASAVVRVDRPDGSHSEHVAIGSAGAVTDEPGDLGTETNPAPVANASYTDAAGQEWIYTVNAFGLRTSITDPLGRVYRLERNVDNLLTTVWMPSEHFQTFSYDSQGRITVMSGDSSTAYGIDEVHITYDDTVDLPATVTDETIGTWANTYDEHGNLQSVTLPDGRVYTFSYNDHGQRLTVKIAGEITTYAYNAQGNLATVADPSGATWTLGYDDYGNLASLTDPDGRHTAVSYNALNQPTRYVNSAGEEVLLSYAPALGSADRDGGGPVAVVTAITDGRGNVSSYAYDEVYNLVRETDALGHATTYEHDGLGRVTAIVQPTGARVDFEYDALDHVTRKTLSTGEVYTYTYDAETGLLAGTAGPAQETAYTYNRFERPITLATTFLPGGPTVQLDYTYRQSNYFGSLYTMRVGDDYTEYGYEFDGDQPLLPADLYGGTYFWISLAYDGLGRLARAEEFYTGSATVYTYDAAGRVQQADYDDYLGDPMYSEQYTYTAAGLLTAARLGDHDWTYGYDEAGRLTLATDELDASGAGQYTYDAAGNRRRAGAEANYTYDAANRLTRDPQYSYEYDAAGNRTARTQLVTGERITYEYDAENRLSAVVPPTGERIEYAYDGYGRRVTRTAGGITTQYVYEGEEELAEFVNGDLAVEYVNGLYVDKPMGVRVGGFYAAELAFFYTDPQGSVHAIADDYGSVETTPTYSAFGEPVDITGLPGFRSFAGRAWDADAGLYYVRERWYDPQAGLFVQRDPLRLTEAIAPYSYAGNRPTISRDPWGLEPQGNYGLRGLVNDQVVQPGINTGITEGIKRIPIGGAGGAAAFGQYNQWKDVINVYGSDNPAEAGIRWYEGRWWNPAGSYVNDFLTLGGCVPRRTARLQRIPGLRSGLRNFFGR